MSSSSRRMRSARNALAEALGLGETFPLRDLPVAAEPPVAIFGAVARILVGDAEAGVVYRLLDQEGAPLAGGAVPQATGAGDNLAIATPPITEDIGFTVHAVRPKGREALLFGGAAVKVGLDAALAVSAVGLDASPFVVDHGAIVRVEIDASQEVATYRLVARPSPDRSAPDDPAGKTADIALSDAAGVQGTGGAIQVASLPLTDDVVVHVRVDKVFTGAARPPQTTLLAATLPLFVRADPGLAVAAAPAILDHAADSAVTVAAPQPGVAYQLSARAVADAEFVRADPPGVPVDTVSADAGPVHVAIPALPADSSLPPAWEAVGAAVVGAGAATTLPLPALRADTLAVVTAVKTHGSGPSAFTSRQRLAQGALVLVRPDPKPPVRLDATIVAGKLTQLRGLGGEPGVFYTLAAAAPLGAIYFQQADSGDATLNKGIGAVAVEVDLIVAAGGDDTETSAAPPPQPVLDVAAVDLPLTLTATARRAMTGLTASLGSVAVPAPPAAAVQPATVVPGATVTVSLTGALPGDTYALAVDGQRVADPVPGTAALSLTTGALAAGAVVELLASGGGGSIVVERRTALTVKVG